MKYIFIFFGIFIISAVAGCGRNYDRTEALLAHAESIMEEYPDSAMAMLDTIDPTSLRDDRIRALYALLITQARYKNYINETNDSLIDSSVKYYINSDDKYHLMKAHFLKGWVNYTTESYSTAMYSAMNAKKVAEDLSDVYYLAKSYELASLISHDTYNISDAIIYTKKAVQYYEQNPAHKLNAQYCILDLAVSYYNQSRYDESAAILDSLYLYVESYDSVLTGSLANVYIPILFRQERFDDVKTIIDRYSNYPGFFNNDTYDYKILSQYYLLSGDIKKASEYIDSARSISTDVNSDIDLLTAEYNLAKYIDNDSMKISALEKLYEASNLKFKRLRDDVAIKAERNFFQSEVSIQKEVADNRYYIIILLIVSSLIIYLSIGWFLSDKNKKLSISKLRLELLLSNTVDMHKKEIIEKTREIEKLKKQITDNLGNSESLNNKIKILENHIKEIKSRQLVIETTKLTITQNPIVQKILMESKSENSLPPISKEEWECLYSIIKTAYPHFFEQLYAVHSLSDFQIQLSVLMKIGVNNTGIAKLLYKSASAITMQQQRLYNKLNKIQDSFSSWKDFIEKI